MALSKYTMENIYLPQAYYRVTVVDSSTTGWLICQIETFASADMRLNGRAPLSSRVVMIQDDPLIENKSEVAYSAVKNWPEFIAISTDC